MQKDAEMHAEEDKKQKELVEARNIAEQSVYAAEKALKDNAAQIAPELKASVEEKVALLKTAKDSENLDTIKSATEALSTELSKIGEAISKAAAQHPPTGGAEQPKEGEAPKDAEFKEEEKK
jgi:molecular chaperone DnaK